MNSSYLILNKKAAGLPIAVGILVFCIFLLMGVSYESYRQRSNKISLSIENPEIIESLYTHESSLNFQIEQIVKSSALGLVPSESSIPIFLQNFKSELEKYKAPNSERYIFPEFEQISQQLIPSSVSIRDNAFIIKFRIRIADKVEDSGFEIISAQYIYEKEFSSK